MTNRPHFKQKPKQEPLKPATIPTVGNAPLKVAAQLVGFCEKTMVDRSKAGDFPGKKIGGRWKFPWNWVREMTGAAG